MTNFLSLLGVSELTTDLLNVNTIKLSGILPYAVLQTDINQDVIGTNLLDGQIMIGDTDGTPLAATITPVVNQTTITNGAGQIIVGTVQDINTTSSPTFNSATLSNLTASRLTASDG